MPQALAAKVDAAAVQPEQKPKLLSNSDRQIQLTNALERRCTAQSEFQEKVNDEFEVSWSQCQCYKKACKTPLREHETPSSSCWPKGSPGIWAGT